METLQHSHDVLALAYRPDGKLLASATLDGQIYLWDPQEAQLLVWALDSHCTCHHTYCQTLQSRHMEGVFPLTNNLDMQRACCCQCPSYPQNQLNASCLVSVTFCSFIRLPLLHPDMYRLSCAVLLYRFCVSIALALNNDAADYARP